MSGLLSSSPYLHPAHGAAQRPSALEHPLERLVRYPDGVAQTTPRKPAGKSPARPVTKKQRRNQAAARSVALEHRPPWQSPTVVTISSVAVVAIVLVVIVLINQVGNTSTSSYPLISATLASQVEQPSASVVSTVGTGGQPGEMIRLPASAALAPVDGKPMVVFVGAEYCPYCAAERWVMLMWLSRFGAFSNVHEMQSSSTDTDPNTDTFTFYKTKYTSSIIDFVPTEVETRSEATLETPTAQIEKIWTTWDQPPYTTEAGQFPFIDIGGIFTLLTTSYDPAILQNLSWTQIGAKLSNATDPVTQAIVGNANILTAATCIATGDSPSSVCTSSTIQNIEATLKTIKPTTA
jgi:hypothetical protein